MSAHCTLHLFANSRWAIPVKLSFSMWFYWLLFFFVVLLIAFHVAIHADFMFWHVWNCSMSMVVLSDDIAARCESESQTWISNLVNSRKSINLAHDEVENTTAINHWCLKLILFWFNIIYNDMLIHRLDELCSIIHSQF